MEVYNSFKASGLPEGEAKKIKDNKRHLKTAGYLTSVLFLYLTFRGTDFGLIISHLNYLQPYYIAGALIFNICFFAIRGFYQINNLHYIKPDIAYSTSVTSIGIAQFYNVILPARIGEVIRTFFLSEREGIQKTSVLSYIFLEKVLDFMVILMLLMLIIISGFKYTELSTVLTFSSIVVISVAASLFVYIRFNIAILSILKKITPKSMHELLHRLNSEALEGFRFYRSAGQVVKSIVLLLLSWTMIAVVFWFISYPYVKLLGLPSYSAVFFMVFSALSLSVPSAPAGIGVMHYGLFLAVRLLGGNHIDGQINLVAAFVIVMHFFITLLDVVVGGNIILYDKFIHKGGSYLKEKKRRNESG